jgi:hypothetical protein
MKPFNLRDALGGKKVVTRNGEKVEYIFHAHNNPTVSNRVIAVLGLGGVYGCMETGMFYSNGDTHPHDLFMAGEKKSGWVAIGESHLDKDAVACTSNVYTTSERAKIAYGSGCKACIKIEWEE